MIAIGLAIALAVASQSTPTEPTDIALAAGRDVAARFECNRCHTGHGLPEVTREKACVGCHAEVEAGTFDAPKDVLTRWQEHIVHLTVVPSLDGARRFRPEWLRTFLQAPHLHDQRPNLLAEMPRLALSAEDADKLAQWLAGPEPTEPVDPLWLASARAGRHLAESKGCGTCHRMTGFAPGLAASALPVTLSPDALQAGLMLAPDLRYTRDRLRAQSVVAWLMKPSAEKPGTAMPDIPMTREEAEDLAAFVLETPLDEAPRVGVPARLPLLTRRVGFDEVKARVFRKTCWHCHSEPDLAGGDGGPGNTGGFGFKGRGLSFVEYTTITAGSIGDDGERRSIFKKIDFRGTPTPRLLAFLLARQVEAAGGEVPGIRGMPLGIPPLSPEDIQLVESWIDQGRPE